jgi:plasmid stability protein
MSTLIIRNFPDDAHLALKVMAASQKGRAGRGSVEGLARSLLVEATRPKGAGLGSRFAAINAELRADLAAAGEQPLTNEEIDALFKRSDEASEPANFDADDASPSTRTE